MANKPDPVCLGQTYLPLLKDSKETHYETGYKLLIIIVSQAIMLKLVKFLSWLNPLEQC